MKRFLLWLAGLFRRRTRGWEFPQNVKSHWYCGAWYLYLADLRDRGLYGGTSLNPESIDSPATGRVAFNPWRTGLASRDKSGLVDGLIPAMRIGEAIGLYAVVGDKYQTTAFYDGAMWDDGYHVDLRLVRVITAERNDDA